MVNLVWEVEAVGLWVDGVFVNSHGWCTTWVWDSKMWSAKGNYSLFVCIYQAVTKLWIFVSWTLEVMAPFPHGWDCVCPLPYILVGAVKEGILFCPPIFLLTWQRELLRPSVSHSDFSASHHIPRFLESKSINFHALAGCSWWNIMKDNVFWEPKANQIVGRGKWSQYHMT